MYKWMIQTAAGTRLKQKIKDGQNMTLICLTSTNEYDPGENYVSVQVVILEMFGR